AGLRLGFVAGSVARGRHPLPTRRPVDAVARSAAWRHGEARPCDERARPGETRPSGPRAPPARGEGRRAARGDAGRADLLPESRGMGADATLRGADPPAYFPIQTLTVHH